MTRSEIVGENIRRARTSLGMSQNDFADAINRKQPTVALYESGQRLPSTQIMSAIAKVLGVSFGELYYSDEERREHEAEPRVDDVIPTYDGCTAEERRLLRAYRNAIPVIRKAALQMLENSAAQNQENLA